MYAIRGVVGLYLQCSDTVVLYPSARASSHGAPLTSCAVTFLSWLSAILEPTAYESCAPMKVTLEYRRSHRDAWPLQTEAARAAGARVRRGIMAASTVLSMLGTDKDYLGSGGWSS